MLIAALSLNLLILVPLLGSLFAERAGMEAAFGPLTDARLILTAVYLAIALVSAGLIAALLAGHPWAVPMTVALFAVQITYKLATVPLVGLHSPVVMTNLGIVAIQIAALAVLWARA